MPVAIAPNVTSVISVANEKGDNKVKPRSVYKSPGIYLTAKGDSGIP